MTEQDDLVVRLVDAAEEAIGNASFPRADLTQARADATAAVIGVLQLLAKEVLAAEEDDNDLWPDSDDLEMIARDVEAEVPSV